MPQDVAWQGRTVHTGVWKRRSAGRRWSRRLNIDGDGQGDLAGHGGEQRAVLVYQLDSYRHWQEFFGRDDLEHGAFGENFTVDGLRRRRGLHRRPVPDRRGRVRGHPAAGDLLPGRHAAGRAAAAVAAGRPPPARVLPAGDHRGRGRGRRRDRPDRTRPARADASPTSTRCSTCPATTGDRLRRRRATSRRSARAGRGRSASMLDAAALGRRAAPRSAPRRLGRVPAAAGQRRRRRERDGRVDPADARGRRRLPARRPGQYLTLRVPGAGDPAPVRSYSLSGDPDGGGYRISVKREPRGLVSTYLHAHLTRVGRSRSAAPRGDFVLDDGADAGAADLGRHRRHAGAGDAARAARAEQHARGVVDPHRPRRGRATPSPPRPPTCCSPAGAPVPSSTTPRPRCHPRSDPASGAVG